MNAIEFFKLDQRASLPHRATQQSAGLDLKAFLEKPLTIKPREIVLVPTGLAVQLPENYVGYIYARSSLGTKHGITLPNGVGVVDSDYRGEIKVALINLKDENYIIESGDRIAQFVVSPVLIAPPVEITELSKTKRSDGGFGSTGKR